MQTNETKHTVRMIKLIREKSLCKFANLIGTMSPQTINSLSYLSILQERKHLKSLHSLEKLVQNMIQELASTTPNHTLLKQHQKHTLRMSTFIHMDSSLLRDWSKTEFGCKKDDRHQKPNNQNHQDSILTNELLAQLLI